MRRAAPPATKRGVRQAAAPNASLTSDEALLRALTSQELTPTHEFTIALTTRGAQRQRRTAAAPKHASVDVAVDVNPTENAVVLVERNGEYTWHYPAPRAVKRRTGRRGLTGTAGARGEVTITITLPPLPRTRTAAGRRSLSVGSAVKDKARAIVLKFVARTSAGVAMRFLERNVQRGLIVMDSDNPREWRRISHISNLNLTGKSTLRILLWVHGTFSSTAGSFGALAATPDGRYLLKQARERYDAVIGFDHATLADTPFENAVDLVDRLGRFETPMQIDAITYSRGGLVFRSLVEQILPSSASRPEIGQVVFVAVPNNGTLFAKPESWKTLVDVYTNLSLGAFTLMKKLPGLAPTATILAGIVSGLGAFVKYLAEVVVTDAVIPGLAAQAPDGRFIRALNEGGEGQPLPESCRYLAVTANFDPKAANRSGAQPTGLAASFLVTLANGLVDRLMNEANDLVVNTPSMKTIDPLAGDFIDASLDFGNSPIVYHTVYFAQGGVAQQLRGWLMDDHARAGLIERKGLLTVRPSPRSPFARVRFHESDGRRRAEPASVAGARRGRRSPAAPADAMTAAESRRNASAARTAAAQHLTKLFGVRSATEPMRPAELAAAAAPPSRGAKRSTRRTATAAAPDDMPRARAYAPRLEEQTVQVSQVDSSRRLDVVSYQQLHRSIPIFGSRAILELGENRHLVAARAKLARVERVSPIATLSPDAALTELLGHVAPLDGDATAKLSKRVASDPPQLNFFHDRAKNTWHLAYVFRDIPAVPGTWSMARRRRSKRASGAAKRHSRHGAASSPRERFPRLDYLVDAHTGSIVYYYSVSPTAAKPQLSMIPVNGQGVDEDGDVQLISVREIAGGFELHDPLRKIRTFDFKNGNIETQRPPRVPIRVADTSANFASVSRPGVSAHLNVTRVFQFYNDVLIRRGVDDRGSYLDNMVNCISPEDEDPPQWGNAIWWKNKMWYGQIAIRRGHMRSLAASLDIIGHELTHGVTEHTSGLVYRDEAGALDESFSDIFGVLIKNRVRGETIYSNPDRWDWEIGSGLGERGKPLRNMKNPKLTGDPVHVKEMSRFDPADLEEDFGGVHTFSNIHNKAAYNVLATRTRARGPLVFTPDQVAQLYYFTLQRLDRVATFEDVLETMLDVVRTVYRAQAEQAQKLDAVTKAYAAVGIPRE